MAVVKKKNTCKTQRLQCRKKSARMKGCRSRYDKVPYFKFQKIYFCNSSLTLNTKMRQKDFTKGKVLARLNRAEKRFPLINAGQEEEEVLSHC